MSDLDDLDRRILRFVAAYDLVLGTQVAQLLGDRLAAEGRLSALAGRGLVRRGPRLSYQFASFAVTRRGLDELGSQLLEPRLDLSRYWRGLAAAWLWLTVEDGAFGPIDRFFTRREMIAADQAGRVGIARDWSKTIRAKAAAASFGVALPGAASGDEHYSDLSLVTAHGRISIELALAVPARDELDAILGGYAAKPTVAAVIFFVDSPAGRTTIQRAVDRAALQDRVLVKPAKFSQAAA